ncbi:PAQR family membrane homeostasis protein TrhA [Anaerotignum propionicum]|uniref:Hemolysin III n=1 Tax=Anaerotignum propionicum DSM 1682 TaxID=991789 RepID=A0A0X1U865_ANAPI|nr:hemolysin III family protein [Anaerotignum propionicum]AMJ41150.1 hemolysin-III related [Anaerotignum propionicum DSM 1682]SHE64704.1 hemolysin III [[Clostridium] propionicum DSM 1682] [Anaerotignum propionicum DSM 1682]
MSKIIFKVKDPISALTHFVGFLAVIPCFILLMYKAKLEASVWHQWGFAIFGISLLLLYGASTIYHTLKLSQNKVNILRRIDHMMIFVLIAGTYTPICLVSLHGTWGWTMLVLIWAFALTGILLKIFWMNAPRWLSTLIYVVMGWLAVIVFVPLEKAVSWNGVGLLLAGGIAYTVGAVIYGLKKPNITFKHFGFHEVFHIFVMVGSSLHIAFMFEYVL